jgi:hypothetical protein
MPNSADDCVRSASARQCDARPPQQIVLRERRRKTSAAGDTLDVGEFHFHRNGPAESPGLVAPDTGLIGHGLDVGLYFG